MRLYSSSQTSFGWKFERIFAQSWVFFHQPHCSFSSRGFGKRLVNVLWNTAFAWKHEYPEWTILAVKCDACVLLLSRCASPKRKMIVWTFFLRVRLVFFSIWHLDQPSVNPPKMASIKAQMKGWSPFLQNHELLGCKKNASLPCFSFKDQMWLRFFAMTQVISEFSGKILHWLKRKRWIEGRELWEPWCDWGNLGKTMG